jgi:methylglutaconyl-CoA hydratase
MTEASPAAPEEVVHLSVTAGVATITLDSPANRNALSAQLVSELGERLDGALDDPGVRAIHLTATGTVFCAGADLKGAGTAATSGFPGILSRIMASPKPVVAELNGHVRAGGIGLVAACDIAVAPVDATFAFTEVRLGLLPAMIAVPLVRRMGRRPLERYFLTGETFGGREAAATGLVTVAAERQDVRAVTAGILDALRQGAPGALSRIKPLLEGIRERDVDDGLAWAGQVSAERFRSEEAAEGMASFRERRPPRWVP